VRVQSWCPFTIQISANGHECEALRSDGTPHVVVRDADIETGRLLRTDGTPRLPILVSLAAEAVDDGAFEKLEAHRLTAAGLLRRCRGVELTAMADEAILAS